MKYVKTQAFRITEETYSLAVALLTPRFAVIPMRRTLNHWVVINQLVSERKALKQADDAMSDSNNVQQKLVLKCTWMSDELFHARYEDTEELASVILTEVVKID